MSKLALEQHWSIKIPHRRWSSTRRSCRASGYEVGHDRKTAYERLKGKRAKTLGIEFGEGVHWRMRQERGVQGNLDSQWSDVPRDQWEDGEAICRKPEGRELETHTHFHGCPGAVERWKGRPADGEALSAVRMETEEIEDTKM